MLNIELSPTQVLFLQNPSKVGIDEIFSTILRDLVIKGVIHLSKVKTYPNARSKKVQKYYRFCKGFTYNDYEPKPFERSFLSPLENGDYVQAKVLTNFVLRNYGMPTDFIDKKIFKQLSKDKYISSLPILKTFGYYSLTQNAKQVLSDVNEFTRSHEQRLESLINGDKAEFIAVMNNIGTYVFQLKKINPDLYQNIVNLVKDIHTTQPLGTENDLSNFMEAFNVDMSYLKII